MMSRVQIEEEEFFAARKYILEPENNTVRRVKPFTNKITTAYINGAHCTDTNEYAYGNVYLFGPKLDCQFGKDKITFPRTDSDTDSNLDGVGGIYAAVNAMTHALVNGSDTLIICSQMGYVQSLCIGDLKAVTGPEKELLDVYDDVRRDVEIIFVCAEKGSRYMKLAEQLTKTAMEL